MRAVILAADIGKDDLTAQSGPLALTKLGNKTLLDHWVEKLERFPIIDEIIVITSKGFYPLFSAWKKETRYRKPLWIMKNGAHDGSDLRGEAVDLDHALQSLKGGSENCLVLKGSVYFDFPLGYFLLPCLGHYESPFIGLYDVKEKEIAAGYGVAVINHHGRVLEFEEKPAEPKTSLVSAGVCYFPAAIRPMLREYVKSTKERAGSMERFLEWLVKNKPVFGIDFSGFWYDIKGARSFGKPGAI